MLLARMKFLWSKGITNDSLATEMETPESAEPVSFAENLVKQDPTDKLWRVSAREDFSDNIWKAVCPVFSASEANYNFRTSTILPFSELQKDVKGGAFSTVHKVAIYEGYYNDAHVQVRNLSNVLHGQTKD
jgi:hypothetical protein